MEKIINAIELHSDASNTEVPTRITIELDGTTPECPVTFRDAASGQAFFIMTNDEIPDFITALEQFAL